MSHTDIRPTQSSATIPANVGAAQTVQKSVSSTIPQGHTRYDGKDANSSRRQLTLGAQFRKNHPTYTAPRVPEFERPSNGGRPAPQYEQELEAGSFERFLKEGRGSCGLRGCAAWCTQAYGWFG
ncbi:hypothetical protein C8J57DRAFT_1223207 [Mycena rebaudengoi]|nr:hypothetical protein C8J57DRAFT_1223207 [Mycena rebaudengoi]